MSQQIKTDCYKCQTETDSYEDAVHPLCDSCQEDFQDWFWRQLTIFTPKEPK